MLRDLVIGMAVCSITWMSVLVWISASLIWDNKPLYVRWGQQDREDRLRLALWASIPIMSLSFLLTRVSKFADNLAYYCSQNDWLMHDVQAGVYLPVTLSFLVLMLWYVSDRVYGSVKGDRAWCYIMWVGVGAGAISSITSWWWVRCPGG